LQPAAKVTVCPLTTVLHGAAGRRPLVAPAPQNGLKKASEVQVDWVHTFSRIRVGEAIGTLDAPTMAAVDEALRRWLDL
jgi:mRNA-degrading endonuclease toxin of MazEF toxin-antitoxin module